MHVTLVHVSIKSIMSSAELQADCAKFQFFSALRKHLVAEIRWKKSRLHSPVMHAPRDTHAYMIDKILHHDPQSAKPTVCDKFDSWMESILLDTCKKQKCSDGEEKQVTQQFWNHTVPPNLEAWQLSSSSAWFEPTDCQLLDKFQREWLEFGHHVAELYAPHKHTDKCKRFLARVSTTLQELHSVLCRIALNPQGPVGNGKPKRLVLFPLVRPKINLSKAVQRFEAKYGLKLVANGIHLYRTWDLEPLKNPFQPTPRAPELAENPSENLYDIMCAITKIGYLGKEWNSSSRIKNEVEPFRGNHVSNPELILACFLLDIPMKFDAFCAPSLLVKLSFLPETRYLVRIHRVQIGSQRWSEWRAMNHDYVNSIHK